ncbi:MAG: type IX secretion system membrane protein PorP/SprF [Cytophagaceae bacterium]
MKQIILLISYFLVIYDLKGQGNYRLPDQFNLYRLSYSIYNPADLTDQRSNVKLGHKSAAGAFSNVRSFYVQAIVQLNSSEKKNGTALGVLVSNEQEGSFIQQTKANLQFRYFTKLSENFKLGAGMGIGFANAVLQSTTSFAGGSDFVPDVNAGFFLASDNFRLGVSGNQLSNSTIRPVHGATVLKRFFTIYARAGKDISPYLKASASGFLVYADKDLHTITAVGSLEYKELLEVGMGYQYLRGLLFSLGMPALNLNKNQFSLFAMYFFSTGKIRAANYQSVELGISFKK